MLYCHDRVALRYSMLCYAMFGFVLLRYAVLCCVVVLIFLLSLSFKFLRGCLCKNHPLNFFLKIFFPETLVIERTCWDYSRNSFGLVQKIVLVALGAVKKIAEPASVGRGKLLKIWHFLRRLRIFISQH